MHREKICVWSLSTGELQRELFVNDYENITLTCNNDFIISGTKDGLVNVIGDTFNTPIMGWHAHNGNIQCMSLMESSSRQVITCSENEIIVWSLERVMNIIQRYNIASINSANQVPSIHFINIDFFLFSSSFGLYIFQVFIFLVK